MAEENNPRWETPEQALKMSWHEVPQKNTHILVQLSRDWVIGLVVQRRGFRCNGSTFSTGTRSPYQWPAPPVLESAELLILGAMNASVLV